MQPSHASHSRPAWTCRDGAARPLRSRGRNGGEPRDFGRSTVSVRFGDFVFHGDRRQLVRSGADVHLTPKAFNLLALLIERAPAVVSQDRHPRVPLARHIRIGRDAARAGQGATACAGRRPQRQPDKDGAPDRLCLCRRDSRRSRGDEARPGSLLADGGESALRAARRHQRPRPRPTPRSFSTPLASPGVTRKSSSTTAPSRSRISEARTERWSGPTRPRARRAPRRRPDSARDRAAGLPHSRQRALDVQSDSTERGQTMTTCAPQRAFAIDSRQA